MEGEKQNIWITERKDLFIRNIIRDFIRSYSFLLEIKEKYENNDITYIGFDQWVGSQADKGILWRLKDLCHRLWRDVDPSIDPDSFIFDWMIGAIFHEAMKLKENAYLVATYKPTFLWAVSDTGTSDRKDKCQQFFQQTVEDVHKGVNKLECLFANALEHLMPILKKEKHNTLLLRFLLEKRSDFERIDPDLNGIGRLIEKLFPEGVDKPYCLAGEGYLEGGWYAEARMAFEEALSINPLSQEARAGLKVLEKRLKEVTLLLERQYHSELPVKSQAVLCHDSI